MANSAHNRSSSLLARALDIHQWLTTDAQLPYQTRVQRDHAIAQRLPSADQAQDRTTDRQTVLEWWAAIPEHAQATTGARLVDIVRLAGTSLLLAGILVGVSATSLALTYTGDYPVNLLSLFAILLGLPWLFLILTAITGCLSAMGLSAGLRLPIGIKRPLLAWLDRMAGTTFRHALGHSDISGKVAYWLLLRISQWFTVGFFVAGIATTAAMVTFSDLAFGWSTTLVVQTQTIHGLFSVLAWPWQTLLPAAYPSLELVEVSQFFRAQPIGQRAAVLGQWWPFVVMSLLVWGLLPRALLLLIAEWRLRRMAVRYLLDHPEVTALLDRVRNPSIAFTHADLSGSSRPTDGFTDQPTPVENASGIDLSWNHAAQGAQITQLAATMTADERADSIDQLRTQLAQQPADKRSIRLFTKGWEPPMHDFMDCVQTLKTELAPNSIQIVPMPLPSAGELDVNDTEQWRLAVARAGIAGVYVLPYQGNQT